MKTRKIAMLALLTTLLGFVASAWERIPYETRHWPSVWKIAGGVLGALAAGLIFLQALDLLDDFIAIFAR